MAKNKKADGLAASIKARLSDRESWESLDADAQLKLVADGIVLYGARVEPWLIELLVPLYVSVRAGCSVADRSELQRAIAGAVNDGRLSFNALFPFLLLDDSYEVVSTSALDLAMFQPGGTDGLDGVRAIIGHVERREVENRGAAFGGLLLLGDDRVCDLLRPLRKELDEEEGKVAVVKCASGYAYVAVVEFLLEWLEQLVGDTDDVHYAHVASALHLTPGRMATPNVISVRRNFGALDPNKRIELLAEYSVKQMATRLEARLYALEAREPPPKVSSAILRAWGLKPKAPRNLQAMPEQ